MPGVEPTDKVLIDSFDFVPRVKTRDLSETHFFNVGSGGKKTIFKCSFAIAVHRFASKKPDNYLPNILIIDTPMQQISERINKDIFENFYKFLYEMATTDLKDTQIIIIDKEYYAPEESLRHLVKDRYMTNNDPQYPPLIDYMLGY